MSRFSELNYLRAATARLPLETMSRCLTLLNLKPSWALGYLSIGCACAVQGRPRKARRMVAKEVEALTDVPLKIWALEYYT